MDSFLDTFKQLDKEIKQASNSKAQLKNDIN
jgi:hypothetical protein